MTPDPVILLSTSLESTNDGDQIIVESILREFPMLADVPQVPTHRLAFRDELSLARSASVLVVTGTNILTGRYEGDGQWPLSPEAEEAYAGKVVFLGVGWREYESAPDPRQIERIRVMRHPMVSISARDSHTKRILDDAGIPAVMTGCPTMWGLSSPIAPLTARECVTTLTDYRPDRRTDKRFIKSLSRRYEQVYLWPQSPHDAKNFRRMWLPRNVTVAPRGVSALNDLLVGRDYVGTRLHGGVRALQLGRSALIVAVDNRSSEIGRDTGLPVVPRSKDFRELETALDRSIPAHLTLQTGAIVNWRETFLSALQKASQ